ncbi:MAG: hypothetical protein AAFO07_10380 [Bacteroidota bacterium]
MNIPPEDIQALYNEALQKDREGDVYTAIKLYKKVTKNYPDWAPPFERLGHLYKDRQDWKAALHYIKKSVSLNPGNSQAWWDLGIAATALKRWRIAKNVWTKFGMHHPISPLRKVIRLRHNKGEELVEVLILDPARAQIKSIPFPGSTYRYNDIVLYDRTITGHYITETERLPIHDAIGVFKSSVYQSASCLLLSVDKNDLSTLEELCKYNEVGIDIWSNAQLNTSNYQQKDKNEYYHLNKLDAQSSNLCLAIAAKRPQHIIDLLENWQVISLKQYIELKLH